jgi:uncharacterized membrane protein
MDSAAENNNSSPQARGLDAGRGVVWWTEGWALFTRSALLWVALGVILFALLALLGMVPVLGMVATSLLLPVFGGGWMLAARKVEQGGALEVADLFACFKGERLTPLLVLGALLLAALVVIGLVVGMLGFGAAFGMMTGGVRHSAAGVMAAMGAGMVVLLVMLVLGLAITMALWFAPALVVFRNVPPVDALRLSATAVLKNAMAFLVYGAIYLAASIVASVPFGLGWIVLLPLSLITAYVSYREVFEAA